MRLNKKDKYELENIISQFERGIKFIMDDKTAVMRESSMSSTDVFTSEYYNGKKYVSICKDIGSDLTGLYNGIERLKKLIRKPESEIRGLLQEDYAENIQGLI